MSNEFVDLDNVGWDDEDQVDGGEIRCSTPDPTAYHDPSSQQLEIAGGGTIASKLPPRMGLRGTIIPRATPMGGSRGCNPHKPGVVQIDPRPNMPAIKLDIGALDEAIIEDAFTKAGGDDMRQIAFNTFRQLAKRVPIAHSTRAAQVGQRDPVQNAAIVPSAPTGLEAPARPASFGSTPVESSRPASVIPPSVRLASATMQPQVNNNAVQPPTVKVTFEVAGFGTFETAYHRVVRGDDDISLVLVYDNRFQGGLKYFPQPSDSPMFVDVHDLPCVFQVRSAGLRFVVDNLEMCVLLIEQVAEKEEAA